DPFGDRLESRLVGDLHRYSSANRDGPEPLASHHGPHARAARDLVQVVGDAGIANEILSGRSDLRDADARIAQLGEDQVLRLAGDLSPQMCGIAELDLAVVDPEVHRRR